MTCGIDHYALERLRGEFPLWAFVHDPFAGHFVAVRGHRDLIFAADPEELRQRVYHAEYGDWPPASWRGGAR
ncbi:MAG: hypothetical protein ACRDQA_30725 [Nocardioidaceae bacterium]